VEKTVKQTSGRRIAAIVISGAVLAVLIYLSPSFFIREESTTGSRLSTGGTSNVELIMANRWKHLFEKAKGIEVSYVSTGSTEGMKRMADKGYAIAFTHAPMTSEAQKAAPGGEVVHVPVVLCAVVPVYNVKALADKPPLKFTGQVLADIFMGKIDRWNHPALKALNPDADLPDAKIVVVHRADSSGTTFIFTDYLAAASPEWAKEMGPAKNEVKWPVGEGRNRNAGVAGHVRETEGAIGYVDLLQVFSGQLPFGDVENKDKSAFVRAKSDTMTAAAASLGGDVSPDLTFSLTNRPGKDAYPICGAIWAVCYRNQPATQQKQVVDFLQWILNEGQQPAAKIAYAPLPPNLVKRAEEKVKAIVATK
jgi:phosphate transport system substrate-binding protein